jgi:hypothetical protein
MTVINRSVMGPEVVDLAGGLTGVDQRLLVGMNVACCVVHHVAEQQRFTGSTH